MNREKAEKLLAALLFDDLDASSKAELTAYLQTDDELRERLADMRMVVKVASDALQHRPEPVLDEKRLKYLSRLAKRSNKRLTVFTMRYMAAAAAVVAAIILPALFIFMPSLNKAKSRVSSQKYSALMSERSDFNGSKEYAMDLSGGTSIAYELENQPQKSIEAFADADSSSIRSRIAGEPASLQLTEESQESEKLYAKALRPENTSGGVGGKYGDGGYAGGGYGDDRRGTLLAFDSNADEMVVAQRMAGNNDGVFDAFSIVPDRQAERSYYYNAPVEALQGDEGSLTVVAKDGSAPIVDGYTVNGQFNFDLETDAVDFPEGVISAGDELAKKVESPHSTETGGKVPDIQVGAGLAPPSTTTKPIPKPATPPPPKQPVQNSIFADGHVAKNGWGMTQDAPDVAEPTSNSLITAKPGKVTDYCESNGVVILQNNAEKKPILGDIPVVGRLFKSEDKERFADRELKAEEEPQAEADRLTKDRKTMQQQRERAVEDYMERTFAFQGEQRYGEALGQLEQVLAVDPLNQQALSMKGTLERFVAYKEQRGIQSDVDQKELELMLKIQRQSVPFSDEINYPRNWKEISERREELLKEKSNLELPVEDITDLPLASRFKSVPVNPWVMTDRDALSTFALDVDTASYTLCRRYISSGYLPPAGAVRMEEFINYFNYQYPQQSDRTFKVHTEAAPSPFAGEGKNLTLLKIGVKARTIGRDQFKPAHLVFVIDTSASMGQPERLPLIQQALNLLLDNLTPADRVTLITCSNQARLLLDTVPVSERERIRQVIDAVQPSGTTNLLAGLQLGYTTARRAYSAKQINQVVLCSDGVANVGQTEAEAVLKAVAQDRKQGITITCVGVGYGTYNDAFMESLADQGDGSYVFLDSLRQAQRVFVEQLAATLHTVAKDARIQVNFNPERVRRYRLIGYENRDIEDARFRDDTIDAGEVGSGQCSTALYELELINSPSGSQFDDFGTVFVRYRNVDTDQIEEISCDLENTIVRTRTVEDSPYFYLAATVAQFAEILRQSEHVQGSNLRDVQVVADKLSRVLGLDRDVRELAELIRRSENLPIAQ